MPRSRAAFCTLLLLLTAAIYGRTCRFDFVARDDGHYVQKNAHVFGSGPRRGSNCPVAERGCKFFAGAGSLRGADGILCGQRSPSTISSLRRTPLFSRKPLECGRKGSNLHSQKREQDPQSCASANSATSAILIVQWVTSISLASNPADLLYISPFDDDAADARRGISGKYNLSTGFASLFAMLM